MIINKVKINKNRSTLFRDLHYFIYELSDLRFIRLRSEAVSRLYVGEESPKNLGNDFGLRIYFIYELSDLRFFRLNKN